MEQLARTDPRHARRPEDFDSDMWVLNTPGGIVDLRTGKMRPHHLGEYHTKIAGAAPGGSCPRWLAFLDEITSGDAELIAYIQRWAGYTLTGATTEQKFIFIWGPGGNGKTVLQSALQTVLGDYATTAMSDVFTVSMTDQHPTHIARLRGARMVIVSETEEGKGWAESRIKSLTGGDKIAARVMRGDPFEYLPQFKLWFAGNHRPSLRNVDPAMQRRLHLVPLTYVPPKPDLGLLDALKAEAPGILAWAIQGCLTWQREGLGMAAAEQTASQDYFSEQDTVSQWFSERCVRDPDSAEPSSVLFEDWVGFARVRGEEPGSAKRFSNALLRFLEKKRSGAGMMFVGVRLLKVEDEVFSGPPAAEGV